MRQISLMYTYYK